MMNFYSAFIVSAFLRACSAANEGVSIPYGPGFIPQASMSMLQLVNQARAFARAPPVCISQSLMNSAKRYSDYLAQIRQTTHQKDGRFPDDLRVTPFQVSDGLIGECLAQTNNEDSTKACDLILRDPPHYAIAVQADFTHMGWAFSRDQSGAVYWTQHFAKSAGAEKCSDQ